MDNPEDAATKRRDRLERPGQRGIARIGRDVRGHPNDVFDIGELNAPRCHFGRDMLAEPNQPGLRYDVSFDGAPVPASAASASPASWRATQLTDGSVAPIRS